MRTSTLEVLNEGELIFGTRTAGSYFVREYEDNIEMSGSFFKRDIYLKSWTGMLKKCPEEEVFTLTLLIGMVYIASVIILSL